MTELTPTEPLSTPTMTASEVDLRARLTEIMARLDGIDEGHPDWSQLQAEFRAVTAQLLAQPVTAPAYTPPPSAPMPEPKRKSRTRLFLYLLYAVVVVVCAVVLATVAMQSGDDGPTALQEVAEQADSTYIDVADEGRTLTINGRGNEESGASFDLVDAILRELDVPASLEARFGNTRALDGTQTADWEGPDGELEATWIYHPDSGFDLVINYVD